MKKLNLLLVLSLFFAFTNAQNILVLDAPCTTSETPYITALANLGYTAIQTDLADFITDLDGGTWDLVVFSEYSDGADDTHWDALNTYLSGGGRLIVSSWTYNSGHTLFSNMGVEIIDNAFTDPMTLHQWVSEHEMFSTPNSVSSAIVPDLNPCNTDGARGNALVGATAVAGLDNAEETADFAAVIVNSTESSIFMGQVPYVWSNAVIVPFLENQIEFLLKDYVGVSELNELGINVFPNPVSDKLIISNADNFNLTVTDITGKMIENYFINDNTFQIDMSGYANGVYIVNLESDLISETVKVVKN